MSQTVPVRREVWDLCYRSWMVGNFRCSGWPAIGDGRLADVRHKKPGSNRGSPKLRETGLAYESRPPYSRQRVVVAVSDMIIIATFELSTEVAFLRRCRAENSSTGRAGQVLDLAADNEPSRSAPSTPRLGRVDLREAKKGPGRQVGLG